MGADVVSIALRVPSSLTAKRAIIVGAPDMIRRRGNITFCILLVLFLSAGIQGGLASGLDDELASNKQRIAAVDREATPIAARLRQVQQAIDQHNRQTVDRRDHAAVSAHNARSDELNGQKVALLSRLKALKDEQDRLAARDQQIEAAISELVRREQSDFDQMNEHWLNVQAELIRQTVSSDRAWRDAVLKSVDNIEVPDVAKSPRRFENLLPGDILLFVPEHGWNELVPPIDYFYRVAEDLARGTVFAAIGRPVAPVSHALTFVKRANGVMLFLDHTSDGSRMLDRRELARKYEDRPVYVARPQMAVDGAQLWAAARVAALRNKPYFGVLPGQLVCSEQACVTVSKAAGVQLAGNRLGPVDITPGDFFDAKEVGKYFIVSPLTEPANSASSH